MNESSKKTEDSYFQIIRVYINKKDYETALNYAEKLLENNLISDNQSAIGRIYNLIGEIYLHRNDYDKALQNRKKALEIRKQLKDNKIDLGESYNDIGVVHYRRKEYKKALEYFNESLNILFGQSEKKEWLGILYLNIASIHYLRKKFRDAEKFFTKAMDVFKNIKSKNYIPYSLYCLGVTNYMLKDSTKALNQIKQSYYIYNEIGNEQMISYSEKVLADIYYDNAHYQEALEHYSNIKKYFSKYDITEYKDVQEKLKLIKDKLK